MRRDLEKEGCQVIECHTEKNGLLSKYWDLRRQFKINGKEACEVLVAFPGHYLMPLAWILTRWPRKKLVFDAFISLHDTLVDDRKKVSRWHPYAWFLFMMDFISCHAADEVLIDTEEHRKFFMKRFSLRHERIRTVYLDARTDIFFPRERKSNPDIFEVFFYGTYIPLQGIEYIIKAAASLIDTNPRIHFTLVGSGQTHKEMLQIAKNKNCTNITFKERIPFTELPEYICNANVCLGIFGTSEKSKRVIPHKVYDAVACGVPILTADTPAIHEKLNEWKNVHLCKAGDGEDIARQLSKMADTSDTLSV